jgi:hypothetical protein
LHGNVLDTVQTNNYDSASEKSMSLLENTMGVYREWNESKVLMDEILHANPYVAV